MRTANKLFTVIVLSAFTAGALAGGTAVKSGSKSFKSEAVSSKEAAYTSGQELAMELDGINQARLAQKLTISDNQLKYGSVKIDNWNVTVDEFANANGEVMYQASLNTRYSYRVKDN